MNRFIINQSIKEQMENWITAVIKDHGLYGEVRKNDRCNMSSNGISLLMRCQTNDIDKFCLVIATVKLDE